MGEAYRERRLFVLVANHPLQLDTAVYLQIRVGLDGTEGKFGIPSILTLLLVLSMDLHVSVVFLFYYSLPEDLDTSEEEVAEVCDCVESLYSVYRHRYICGGVNLAREGAVVSKHSAPSCFIKAS